MFNKSVLVNKSLTEPGVGPTRLDDFLKAINRKGIGGTKIGSNLATGKRNLWLILAVLTLSRLLGDRPTWPPRVGNKFALYYVSYNGNPYISSRTWVSTERRRCRHQRSNISQVPMAGGDDSQ
jgi:hypothetical protein